MKIAYCFECKVVIAAGALPAAVRQANGRPVACAYSHTIKGGAVHKAKLIEADISQRAKNESVDAYLVRLAEENKGKLV